MNRLMWVSKSGMIAQQNKLDSISNNVANSTTTGYKKVDVGFSDLLQDTMNRKGYPIVDKENSNLEYSSGVKSTESLRYNKQGNLMQTNRPIDLAIDGSGYFEVTMTNGRNAYTRDGAFLLDAKGDLVNNNGYKVTIMKDGQALNLKDIDIKVTSDNISIDESGNILLKDDNDKIQNVGSLKVIDVIGDKSFISMGDSLFILKEGSQVINNPDYSIRSGFLEMSNVDLGEEMSELIISQRAFQMNSQALRTADEMWGMVNSMRGR